MPGSKTTLNVGHLTQRHRCAGRCLHIDVVQGREEIACVGRLAQHHLDGLVVVPELADLEPGQHGLQRAADCLRGDAQGTGAILIDVQLQARHRLQPVVVHVADLRRCPHYLGDLAGEAAHLLPIGARHAHLHGPTDRRTVEQTIGLGAYVREVLRQHVAHAGQHALARLERLRHQEQLGKVLVLELLIERADRSAVRLRR